MFAVNRRRFLQAAAVGAASLAADVPPKKVDEGKPKFRLGLVTYNLAANWDLPSLLKACRSAGISPVELRTTHKHGVEPSLSKEDRKEVKQRFADAGVEIWGCGTVCEFQSPDQAVVQKNIETCKQFVELVADLGGKGVKVRPNGLPKEVEVVLSRRSSRSARLSSPAARRPRTPGSKSAGWRSTATAPPTRHT